MIPELSSVEQRMVCWKSSSDTLLEHFREKSTFHEHIEKEKQSLLVALLIFCTGLSSNGH